MIKKIIISFTIAHGRVCLERFEGAVDHQCLIV